MTTPQATQKKYEKDPNKINTFTIETINKEVKERGYDEEKVGFNLVHYVATCGPLHQDVYEIIRSIFQKCAHNKEKLQKLINCKTENLEKRKIVNEKKARDNCSMNRFVYYVLFINYNMLLIYGTFIS